MARAAVLLANGFEEIEAVTLIDVLRRGGVEVVTLGVDGESATGAHGIAIHCDAALTERGEESWDVVVLPGGMPGAATLRDRAEVQALLRRQHEAGKKLAAICAAPIALAKAGVLRGKRVTSFPGYEKELAGATLSSERVVVDGSITTSRGPGTAMDFALRLVADLAGEAKAAELREQMLV